MILLSKKCMNIYSHFFVDNVKIIRYNGGGWKMIMSANNFLAWFFKLIFKKGGSLYEKL